ncbi:hypothetical protein [Stenotrophomonas indicatrix]|uniref:hypothetical protein n=1 Tax=Stenotrophomonas indicatrix TaxID=2045451 RepID=UPI00215A585D|nr:hypothetical protein [Stenotrophomonas indicatrix]MCR8714395.1 hypothetical protein [Stenotrophomonas indicatrix]
MILEQSSWVVRGKTIKDLIEELMTFEDQDLFVEISVDGGDTVRPISLVGREGGKCVLFYFGESD